MPPMRPWADIAEVPLDHRAGESGRPRAETREVSRYTFDAVMQERGTAISAMRYLSTTQECLPSLTDAMENFKEYDPDEEHQGPLAESRGPEDIWAEGVTRRCHLPGTCETIRTKNTRRPSWRH